MRAASVCGLVLLVAFFASLATATEPRAPATVRLPMKIQYGVPSIPCTINGRQVWMIIDTGSQITLLSSETAARLGVSSRRENAIVATLSGSHGQETARLANSTSVGIGPWISGDLPLLIRDRPGDRQGSFSRPVLIDVLSIRVLRRLCSYMTLDAAAGEVEFGTRDTFTPASHARAVPLGFRNELPYAQVEANGARVDLLVDTGSSAPLELNVNDPAASSVRFIKESSPRRRIGIGKPSTAASRVRTGIVSDLAVGSLQLRDVEAALVNDRNKLGFGVLRRFRATFDFRRDRLWLEPR